MSYIKRVLADRPLGFWNLDSTSDLTDGDNDIVIVSRPNAITEVISLNTSTYKDKDTNNFIKVKGLLLNSSADLYVPNAYNILGKGLEHLNFGIEFWFTIPPSNTDDNQNLIQFHELGNDVDQTVGGIYIYADTIYFSLNGSTKTYVVSKQLTSKDSQIHVFATYSNKTMSIYVNGILGQTISLPEDFEFVTEDKTNVRFQFKYESNPTLFNSLAIYNRALLDQEIKSHIYWGLNDGTPVSYVKGKNVSVIDINENINNYWYTKNFNNKSSFSEGASNNIVVDSLGITLPSGPYINTENSKTKINSISSFLNTNNFSISGTLDDWSALSSNFEILRLDGFDLSSYLSLIKSSNNKLRLNYVSTSETTTLIETGAVTSTNGKFIFSIDGSHASIYIDGAGSFFGNIIPVKNSSSNLYFPLDTEESTTFSEYIDIFNTYVDPNAFIDDSSQYTDSLILSVDREGNYVKKKGYWEYVVPASLFYNIVGSRISWDSATNQISKDITSNYFKSVYVEIDRGSGWEQIKNGMGIENFQTINDAGTDFKIRITLLSSFYIPNGMSESIYQPRLENLSISLYKDLSVLSDDSKYKVVPYYDSDNNLQHTYTLKNNNLNILSRSNNFGIKLNEGSAAAIINSTSNEGKKSLEFWFRPDVIGSEQDQYILDTQDSENYYIKFDKDTKLIDASIQGSSQQQKYFLAMPYAPGDGYWYFALLSSTDYTNWNLESIEPTQYSGSPQIGLYHVPGKIIANVYSPVPSGTKIFVSEDNGVTWNKVLELSYQYRFFNVGDYIFLTAFGSGAGDLWWCNINNLAAWNHYGTLESNADIRQVANGAQGFYFIGGAYSYTPKIYYLTITDIVNQTAPNTVSLTGIDSSYFLADSVYEKMNNFVYLLYRDQPFGGNSYLYKIDANQAANSSFSTVSIPTSTPWHRISIYAHQSSNQIDAFLIPENDYHPIKSTTNLQNANPTWTTKYTFGAPGGSTVYINKILNMAISSSTIITYDNGQNWTTTSITPTSIPTGWDSSYTNLIKIQITNDAFNHGMDSITETINTSGFNKVYINSNDLSLSPFTVMDKEPIHIVCIYSENNINNIYLNKSISLDGDLSATYGYIALYPNELSSSEVYDRYISFLTNKTEIVNESNSIGTLAEYSGGDAVVAYSSASKQAAI